MGSRATVDQALRSAAAAALAIAVASLPVPASAQPYGSQPLPDGLRYETIQGPGGRRVEVETNRIGNLEFSRYRDAQGGSARCTTTTISGMSWTRCL
ncbi:hypothetical protein [Synechococcus sp. EJ6-Ellesmere]|uniref:hypothetical protein n=1 Tax=Synechococcus sp. EJ6-Ellesmere TaxID=2823734 RepID=UPI0020CC18A9|nr:hypothetical protein [Synechococcus sp. EJ6-Ellesmere]MCP9823899.1 hypothetical protein [Synechococcus sp. EJ6-Ellesmere]